MQLPTDALRRRVEKVLDEAPETSGVIIVAAEPPHRLLAERPPREGGHCSLYTVSTEGGDR